MKTTKKQQKQQKQQKTNKKQQICFFYKLYLLQIIIYKKIDLDFIRL